MRIAIACFSDQWGGREILAKNTLIYLKQAGVDVLAIVCPEYKGTQELKKHKITIEICKIGKYFDFWGAFKLAKILKKYSIKYLGAHHTRNLGSLSYVKMFYPAVKISITHHIYSRVNKKTFLRYLWIKNINYFIAVSLKMKENLIDIYPSNIKNKIKLIYNGIDNDFFKFSKKYREERRKFYGYKDDDFVIGMIGRLDQAKEHTQVIQALAKINNPKFKLLIVGNENVGDKGFYTKRLKKLIKNLSLNKQINFIPFTDKVNKEYNAIDLFLMTSKIEAFGMVVAEAMLSKVPIIMSNTLGLQELTNNGKTALEYKYRDIKDLTKKINEIYSNLDLKNSLIDNAYKYASKKFTTKVFIQKLQDLFSA